MDAKYASFSKLLEPKIQFMVPHFQRPYSWISLQWRELWEDILSVRARWQQHGSTTFKHFIGPVVAVVHSSSPLNATRLTLIDGQQRLTTITVLVCALRDRFLELGDAEGAKDLHNTYLVNPALRGPEHLKLLSSKGREQGIPDKSALESLCQRYEDRVARRPDPSPPLAESRVLDAYEFFRVKLSDLPADRVRNIAEVVLGGLSVVFIDLGADDDPYSVFECLNAKGLPLTQADLIRNYFFMRIPADEHDRAFSDGWAPLEKSVTTDGTSEFFRYVLTLIHGYPIKKQEVYQEFREHAKAEFARPGVSVLQYLRGLQPAARRYAMITSDRGGPDAPTRQVARRLARLRRIEIGQATPLLMELLNKFEASPAVFSEAWLLGMLTQVESFAVRRYVCLSGSHGLNKEFAALARKCVQESNPQVVADLVLRALGKACPSDAQFVEALSTQPLYGTGEKGRRAHFLLSALDSQLAGDEAHLNYEEFQIEHVMPRTLSPGWRGPEFSEEEYERCVHLIGNLTLTGAQKNPEMSNRLFLEKKPILVQSSVVLNQYFAGLADWTLTSIRSRAQKLCELALAVWPGFGSGASTPDSAGDVTRKKPRRVRIEGWTRDVTTWRSLLEIVARHVVDVYGVRAEVLLDELPRAFRRPGEHVREPVEMANGLQLETHFSAKDIYAHLQRLILVADLDPRDPHQFFLELA